MPKTALKQAETPEDDFHLCPHFSRTFEMLDKKWNGLIIEVLLNEKTQRFKDLAAHVEACSDRVLSVRLKELEDEGIVQRNTYQDSSRIDYSLTEKGQELEPVMHEIHGWSDKWC